MRDNNRRENGPTDEDRQDATPLERSYPDGWAVKRRAVLSAMGAAGAAGLAGCAGGSGESTPTSTEMGGGGGQSGGGEPIALPRNDDAFSGMELNLLRDGGAPLWHKFYGPKLEEESGVTFAEPEVGSQTKAFEKFNSDIIAGGDSSWDFVEFNPLYFANVAARGALEPLDKYFEKYKGTDKYLDDVKDPFLEFYSKFDGNLYSVVLDGDILVLHYRPSYFEDETHQEEYEAQYGQKLRVPKTWPEYLQVAEYFTENTEDGIFGTQILGARPWNWGWFYARAASKNILYFDRDMNPQINQPGAVEALQNLVDTVDYSPPGTAQMSFDPTIANWTEGKCIMSVWWTDLGEIAARSEKKAIGNDFATARMPGWKRDDGSVKALAPMANGRVAAIPKNVPEERKEAAFYSILRVSQKYYSNYTVSDPATGCDAYMGSHFVGEGLTAWTTPNKRRGTNDKYPDNKAIFDDKENARKYLEGIEKNLEIGIAQPSWPGAAQLIEQLGIHVQRALTGQESPQEALDQTAKEWESTVDDLGRDTQKQLYNKFVDTAVDLGVYEE